MTSETQILLVDPAPRSRLATIAALSSTYAVGRPDEGERPIRAARRLRPDITLLTLHRGHMQEVMRLARALKTEPGRPTLIGLLDPAARLAVTRETLGDINADGYAAGRLTDQVLTTFVAGVLRRELPIHRGPPHRSLLDRLLRG